MEVLQSLRMLASQSLAQMVKRMVPRLGPVEFVAHRSVLFDESSQ